MTRDVVILLAILIVILVPLMWARAKMDKLHSDAAKRVFKSWGRTWRRLGRPRGRKH